MTIAAPLPPLDLLPALTAPPSRHADAPTPSLPLLRWPLLVENNGSCRAVVLGVGDGALYEALCESAADGGGIITLTGIDPWESDPASGLHGDLILATLQESHDRHFGAFSTLRRAPYGEALESFDDGTIDLLILGADTDLDPWLECLSPRGVIAVTGITGPRAVAWNRLAGERPQFALIGDDAAGLVVVGSDAPEPLRALCALSGDAAAGARKFFAALGAEAARAADLRTWTEARRGLSARINEMARKEQELRLFQAGMMEAHENEREQLQEKLRALHAEYAVLERHAGDAEATFKAHSEHLQHLQQQLANKQDSLDALYASTSWRVTAPFRSASSGAARAKIKLLELIKAVLRVTPGGDRLLLKLRAARQVARGETSSAKAETAGAPAADSRAAKEAFRTAKAQEFERFLTSGAKLPLPAAYEPKVSILLVLYNQAPLTYACLRSLARENEIPCEVIVIDNASSDKTGALLDRLEGARVVRNEENLGFLLAVNQAAEMARGEHLLLLNNDATLRPGTLISALETLESSDDIGAVGGRIVLLDGTLQEAGSIIWSDGSCLGYARGADPEDGVVQFRRDVDYASGAFLLTRRTLWAELDGFDTAYAPAYYEESDYCLRLWEAGKRVVYEPDAVVDHFEFASALKSDWAIEQQRKNRLLFLEKHKETLARQQAPDPAHILAARARPTRNGRVLVIDDRVPHAALGSGFPRARDLLLSLHRLGCAVTLYPLQFPGDDWDVVYASLPREVEVLLGRGLRGLEGFLRERRGHYDRMIVSRPHNMEVVKTLHNAHPELFEGTRLIYDAEAIFAHREINQAKLSGTPMAPRKAARLVQREVALAERADAVLTVSEIEARPFYGAGVNAVHVLGHCLAPEPTARPFARRQELLFVGALVGEDTPNVDSLIWFTKEVLPLVQAKLPRPVRLLTVGRVQSRAVHDLAGDEVLIQGRKEDLTPFYDGCRVFVAPTRFAAGIPHKVHEAAARGIPTVCTGLLAEQLGWIDGEALMAASDPEGFAERVVRLYTDEVLWNSIRAGALAALERDCSPESFQRTIAQVLEGTARD